MFKINIWFSFILVFGVSYEQISKIFVFLTLQACNFLHKRSKHQI